MINGAKELIESEGITQLCTEEHFIRIVLSYRVTLVYLGLLRPFSIVVFSQENIVALSYY